MGDLTEPTPERGAELVDLDERRWLPRHAAGDAAAFGELMAAYRAPVFGYLVRARVEPGSRDDLFQEIFMKVHGAAASYQPARPLRPWLFTIVANSVRNHFRRRRIEALAFAEGAEEQVASLAPGPLRVAEARATLGWLESALEGLAPVPRQVLLLSAVEGMDHRSIGEALELPVNTVKTHLRRARLKLAIELHALDDAGGGR